MKQSFNTFTSIITFIGFVMMTSSIISVPLLVAYVYTTGSLIKSIGMASMWTIAIPAITTIVVQMINEVVFGNQD